MSLFLGQLMSVASVLPSYSMLLSGFVTARMEEIDNGVQAGEM